MCHCISSQIQHFDKLSASCVLKIATKDKFSTNFMAVSRCALRLIFPLSSSLVHKAERNRIHTKVKMRHVQRGK